MSASTAVRAGDVGTTPSRSCASGRTATRLEPDARGLRVLQQRLGGVCAPERGAAGSAARPLALDARARRRDRHLAPGGVGDGDAEAKPVSGIAPRELVARLRRVVDGRAAPTVRVAAQPLVAVGRRRTSTSRGCPRASFRPAHGPRCAAPPGGRDVDHHAGSRRRRGRRCAVHVGGPDRRAHDVAAVGSRQLVRRGRSAGNVDAALPGRGATLPLIGLAVGPRPTIPLMS